MMLNRRDIKAIGVSECIKHDGSITFQSRLEKKGNMKKKSVGPYNSPDMVNIAWNAIKKMK